MPPIFPLDEEKLRKLLAVSTSAVVAAAMSSGVSAAACPTFPEFGYYAKNVMCTKIPTGTNVSVTSPPTNGKLVFADFNADGKSDELFYLGKGNSMPDSFSFTADGAVTDAGDVTFSWDDLNGYGGR